MNKTISDFARVKIKEGLYRLPEGWQDKFKLMYAGGNNDLPINQVVDKMPDEKLDQALTQVENSLNKLGYGLESE